MAMQTANQSIPPLEDGDRLDADEFRRRLDAMPEKTKAELINGIVYLNRLAGDCRSGQLRSMLGGWLFIYTTRTPGVGSLNHPHVWLVGDHVLQPASVLMIHEVGDAKFASPEGVPGVPELAAEFALGSDSKELHEKLRIYEQFGVGEYIVWRVYDAAIDWFVLEAGRYRKLAVDAEGVYRSFQFPGLWLDAAGALRDDRAAVVAGLMRGTASPEHADFVAKLRPPAP